ncbi:hypothetical protein OS493_026290 [Desmophyllum pertusum]|uniref:VWFC domain-containing protein n=1 Tax=Desmophyllum pertusum TaxID=174260 RepID=A0A9X0D3R9_9CNID|nr:hypothetical protein OS493_026290 [Desmophyllum pertusum]
MARFCDVIFAAILVFFLTEGTSSTGDLAKEINIFKEVGLGDKAFAGVTSTTGQNDKSTAYHFTTSTPNLLSSPKAFGQADNLIHNSHDFIVSAYAKIDANSRYSNPIVSISSKDGHEFGNSRGKGLDITVTVQLKGAQTKTFTAQSNRYLDYTKWFKITNRFKGDLQDVKLMLGSSLNDCPSMAKCKCSDVLGTKNCVVDGNKYEDGTRWTKDKCTICQCKWGQVICTHTCQACKDNGQTYLHGETWKSGNDSCQNCKCEEGNTTCSPPPCPKPDCSGKSGDLITPKESAASLQRGPVSGNRQGLQNMFLCSNVLQL